MLKKREFQHWPNRIELGHTFLWPPLATVRPQHNGAVLDDDDIEDATAMRMLTDHKKGVD